MLFIIENIEKMVQKTQKWPKLFKKSKRVHRKGPPYSNFICGYLISLRNDVRCQKLGRVSHFREIKQYFYKNRSKRAKNVVFDPKT